MMSLGKPLPWVFSPQKPGSRAPPGAPARVEEDVGGEAAALDVLAQEAVLSRLRERARQPLRSQHELAPAVNERRADPQRVGSNNQPLDQLVRVLLDQLAVVVRARLA